MPELLETRAPAARRWLELALDYRCNLRCIGCHACEDTGGRMSSQQAAAFIRSGRDQGIERLWLGGGEPTLRDDLFALVRGARRLGYREVALQTNGMRLAYPAYRDAALAAGVTEFRFNVKSHRAEVHDRLSGDVPSHALLLQAIEGLASGPARVVADVLLAQSTAPELPELVAFFAPRGVRSFVLWLLSTADSRDARIAAEVPRIRGMWPALAAARDRAEALGATLETLHTPPCTLPSDLRRNFSPASELALLVVGPDAVPFPLEASPFEGGAYTSGCARCAVRASCGGPRADYRKIHGDEEFVPIVASLAMGGGAPS